MKSTANPHVDSGRSLPTVDRLPIGALSALAMTGFVAIMTETVPAGLLRQIGDGLHVSEAGAGQLVTLYALGSVLGAIPLIAVTRGWNRRRVLLLAICGFCIFNLVTALSPNYVLTLGARLLAGMAAGVVWGLLAGYARRIVEPHQQGRAVAVALVGQPAALALGMPLGAWLGTLVDWRVVFTTMSVLAIALAIWVLAQVPDFPGQQVGHRVPIQGVLTSPGMRPILFVVFTWMLAHNILYTYIAPFSDHVGLGDRIGLVLLVFGVMSFVGIWIVGLFADRMLRSLTLTSLAVFAAVSLLLAVGDGAPILMFVGFAAWGLTFGGSPTLLQTALADTAGDAADTGQSILVTVFNLAVAMGGMVGGLLLESSGAQALTWAVFALAAAGTATVWLARSHGFTPGPRTSPA
ncbi:MFS transporter [Rhodococcus sp. SRB_17]|nr:MFS transporter [Rhodococcus sp. SRB_17]